MTIKERNLLFAAIGITFSLFGIFALGLIVVASNKSEKVGHKQKEAVKEVVRRQESKLVNAKVDRKQAVEFPKQAPQEAKKELAKPAPRDTPNLPWPVEGKLYTVSGIAAKINAGADEFIDVEYKDGEFPTYLVIIIYLMDSKTEEKVEFVCLFPKNKTGADITKGKAKKGKPITIRGEVWWVTSDEVTLGNCQVVD